MISVACRAECEEAVIVSIGEHYDELLKCSDAYDTASISAKKTIVSRIIDRVDVLRDYQLKIKLTEYQHQTVPGQLERHQYQRETISVTVSIGAYIKRPHSKTT